MPDAAEALRDLLAVCLLVQRRERVPLPERGRERPVVVRLTLEESHALSDAVWRARAALEGGDRG